MFELLLPMEQILGQGIRFDTAQEAMSYVENKSKVKWVYLAASEGLGQFWWGYGDDIWSIFEHLENENV